MQFEEEETFCLYGAIDIESNVVLHAQLSTNRGRDPAESFLAKFNEKDSVEDAEVLVDGMAHLTLLARTHPSPATSTTRNAPSLRHSSRRTRCISGDFTTSGTVVMPAPTAG